MREKEKGRSEFALIADLFAPLSKRAAGALDLKDDAALVDVQIGEHLVVAADTLIAGVHFREEDPPETVGRKALRVNLSDLAAMGAKPVGFLQTLTLNDQIGDAYLQKYAKGLEDDATHFDIPLLGGDTTVGRGPLTVTIAILGSVRKGDALLRSGAQAGDILCVTGTIGDGALGLKCAQGTLKLSDADSMFLRGRYQRPEPRIEIGCTIAGRASACIDVSDGLVADVGHICDASEVIAVIEKEKIPLSNAGRTGISQDPDLWNAVFGGGDDYELAFTVPPDDIDDISNLGSTTGTAVTVIGRILPARNDKMPVTVVDENGMTLSLPSGGYRHR